jgi:cyclohexanone monooxygenase
MAEQDSPSEAAGAPSGYDRNALRAKYREEREKRIRPEGSRQYRRGKGDLSHYLTDPFRQQIEREPVRDVVEVAVIGAGFGGLLLGARLREAGVTDLRLVERGSDVGGAWYWNRYPGAACDTEAYVYLPLLEETGYIPTERYAKGAEILEHARRIARQYDLYRNALLETAVSELRWSEDELMWHVSTDRGDAFWAKYVCMTTGTFIWPKFPGVPGIETFKGKSLHTSRWDYSYTKGDGNGNLTGLNDKRVAVIGTGATAVGCIPHVGRDAQQLYVFQRTPAAVGERNNSVTDPEWVASLQPGWHKARLENFSAYLAGDDAEEDLVKDGWTEIIRKFRSVRDDELGTDVEEAMERADFERMEEVRNRVERIVKDKEVADALKPYYRALCKRPCFHDEYLDTFNRPNVTLVDTAGRGVDAITEHGVVANGVEYEVDCIIFASGFETASSLRSRVGYDVFGRDGLALSTKWRGGMSTLYGMQTHDFPNLFIVSQAQVGVSSNQTHPLNVQSGHIAYVISESRRRGARTVDVSAEAEEWWVQRVIDTSRLDIEFLESCTPSYFNNEGHPHAEIFRRNGRYAPGIPAFSRELDEWKATGELHGQVFDEGLDPLPANGQVPVAVASVTAAPPGATVVATPGGDSTPLIGDDL